MKTKKITKLDQTYKEDYTYYVTAQDEKEVKEALGYRNSYESMLEYNSDSKFNSDY